MGLADPAEAVRWMRTLNRDAADVLRAFAPSAVTDVTGFGLLGHAHEMATRSGVRIELAAASLPALDGALESARAGVSTAGTRNNRAYADVEVGDVAPELVELAYDPQTAGGLLIVAAARPTAPRSRPSSRAQDCFWRASASVAAGCRHRSSLTRVGAWRLARSRCRACAERCFRSTAFAGSPGSAPGCSS